jgi:division protein CdvB (Snf7/Vps24/ESCRT-III family)
MAKALSQTKLALEQISLRIKTTTSLGDVAVTLLPVISTISDVKTDIESINPQAEKEIEDIGDLLSGIVVDVGVISGMNISFELVNEDSSKILEEAQTIAESRLNETFISHLEQKRRPAGNVPLT